MSIRLDPRRVNALKHLAGEAGVRPGDLVRQWVEERLDASRGGPEAAPTASRGASLLERLEDLVTRVNALEAAASAGRAKPETDSAPDEPTGDAAAAEAPAADEATQVSALPSAARVALHDEMIAVIRKRGPLSAGELAVAIVERGRYSVPRSGKALDAKTVSQRVSNPTYRARFVRREGRIGLADQA